MTGNIHSDLWVFLGLVSVSFAVMVLISCAFHQGDDQ